MSETVIPIHPLPSDDAPQRVVKVRRDYNSWVARETLDALRVLLADPEFATATPDATLEGFMAALADQGQGSGAPGQQKARRAKKAKRRR